MPASSTKKVITTIGIILIFLSLGIGGYFVYQKGLLVNSSDPEIQPSQIRISNINSDGFTVSWITNSPTKGSIIYGENKKLDQVVLDANDELTGQEMNYKLHYINVKNLKPGTDYYFKIRSGEKNFLFDNQGQAFVQRTAPELGTAPQTDMMSGEVSDNNAPAAGAIVYVEATGLSPLSAQVKKDGKWLVNLSGARNKQLTDYVSYDSEKAVFEIKVQGDKKTATAKVIAANKSPVPKMILGEGAYDFTTTASEIPDYGNVGMGEEGVDNQLDFLDESLDDEDEATNSAEMDLVESEEASNSGESEEDLEQFPSFTDYENQEDLNDGVEAEQYQQSNSQVEIINPAEEDETLSTNRPQFIGTGPANKVLTVRIDNGTTRTVYVDSGGDWSMTPSQSLSNGEHEIIVDYVDAQGISKSVSRGFVIGASTGVGGDPAIEASGTATPLPSTTPTVSPRAYTPSTASGVPTSGNTSPTLILLSLGLVLIGGGIISRKNVRY